MDTESARSSSRGTANARRREILTIAIVLLLLAGLPLAVWMDVRNLTIEALRRQATDVNSLISGIRSYYSSDVVGRVLANHGEHTQVIPNYDSVPGAIPLPATLSLTLGNIIGAQQSNIHYRFVSDFPFRTRTPHALDAFERESLAALRAKPGQLLTDASLSGLTSQVRVISPVVMAATCVACHNSHPDSLKHDWKVGDVRGIQEVTVTQPVASNLWSFKYILAYFLFTAAAGLTFIYLQRRQHGAVRRANAELQRSNEFLAAISMKISHYLSPQIYKSIFSGEMDASIRTERKKLTIFFSDVKDFTELTESLQPEEMTALINEYFTEMSAIALRHGGTIDKFIGDAILVFFGDPTTSGTAEDAKACVGMAIEMQQRVAELNVRWRKAGSAEPFRVRMGINTGYCNVGNFGSSERMDYTILGAEANLAARLQSIARPGRIVMSYETYALVRTMVAAHPLPPTSMKGIAREVVPYELDGRLDAEGAVGEVFSEHSVGLDLYLDLARMDAGALQKVRAVLDQALQALDKQKPAPAD
jgi:adenylate cyclase